MCIYAIKVKMNVFNQVYKSADDVCMFAAPCYDLHTFFRQSLPSLFALQRKGIDVKFVYNYSYFTCTKLGKTFVIEHSDTRYLTPEHFSKLCAHFLAK